MDLTSSHPANKAAKPTHPLFQRMINECGAVWIDAAGIDAFLSEETELPSVILLAGDPVRYPEGLDVAVVLPELVKVYPNQCRLAIVKHEDESTVAKRFAVLARPTLLFTKGNQYLTIIAGMHDWDVFITKFGEALQASPQKVPIPIVPVSSASQCS